ncbi:Structural maintenance of chromosomes protein 4 [Spatholobus suberectus]|nr:Structural maintenance of chromosomes protein 4 [Spatholobus suberectus]
MEEYRILSQRGYYGTYYKDIMGTGGDRIQHYFEIQKVAELKFVLDSKKSHGSVLKEILRVKETNQIEGIYCHMGDLGIIDGKAFQLQFFWLDKVWSFPN